MILSGLEVVGIEPEGRKSIGVHDTVIDGVWETPPSGDERTVLTFGDAIACPGLVNSHDHLEFNLYPRLSSRVYEDYIEWGPDIHERFKHSIDRISQIPELLRSRWGAYKNLLCGVTTVVQHGTHLRQLEVPFIDVYQRCESLHSVAFGRSWRRQLNIPWRRSQIAIHIGEGVSARAGAEVGEFLRWNCLRKKVVGIHGIAMDESQAKQFEALVWCPESNLFLFGRTAEIAKLKNHTPILFGTDSALTAPWDLWEHLRTARALRLLTDQELFESLTSTPSRIWSLGRKGQIKPGHTADIIVGRRKCGDIWDAFYSLTPKDILLVIRDGALVHLDDEVLQRNPGLEHGFLTPVFVSGTKKWVAGDFARLTLDLREACPDLDLPAAPA